MSWNQQREKQRRGGEKNDNPWFSESMKPENFVPGLLIGFLLGLFVDLSTAAVRGAGRRGASITRSNRGGDGDLKMVGVSLEGHYYGFAHNVFV